MMTGRHVESRSKHDSGGTDVNRALIFMHTGHFDITF